MSFIEPLVKRRLSGRKRKKTLELQLPQLIKDSLQSKSRGQVELEKALKVLNEKKSDFAKKTAEVENVLKSLEIISKKSAQEMLEKVHTKFLNRLRF